MIPRSRFPLSARRRWPGLLVALSLAGAGCGGPSTSDKSIELVDPNDAQLLVRGTRKGLLIFGANKTGAWVDPRGENAYRQGHIPGAIHMPFKDVADEHKLLRRFDVLVVYGKGYADPLADAMSKRLIALGHSDVRTLEGGLQAWTEAGNEVEAGAPDNELID